MSTIWQGNGGGACGAVFPADSAMILRVPIKITRGEPAMGPTARFMFTIVGSAAYLGLAVLGWGGFAGFFSHPALVALAVVLFVISGAAFFAGGNLSPACARIAATAGSSLPLG
jgi:hypothetical protein